MISILEEGSWLWPQESSSFRCRWWSKEKRQTGLEFLPDRRRERDWVWRVLMEKPPDATIIRQMSADSCKVQIFISLNWQSGFVDIIFMIGFLECGLCITCVIISNDSSTRKVKIGSIKSLDTTRKKEIIGWIMVKPQQYKTTSSGSGTLLSSRIFFHTTEYSVVPRSALDLLHPLLQNLENAWRGNLAAFQERLATMVSFLSRVIS